MNPYLMWFLVFWAFVLLFFMSIGGYFMFRKFFKALPMADGKSKLDRQNEYLERARGMWGDDSLAFLDQLVEPVPSAFRDIARHSIAARIAQVALEERAKEVTREHCMRGYILATPKRDHRSMISFFEKNGIDYAAYRDLLN
jgi:hypothetical protein